MDAVKIGNRLRCEREKKKKSLRQVSEAVEISRSALAMYENGHRIPRDSVKARLAKYYGKSITTLFFADEDHLK